MNHKEGWMPKNWCFWTVVLEKTLENPLECGEIKPVNPKGNQFWISLGGLMLKLQYFGHLMQRADALEKILMLGKMEGGGGGDSRGWDGWMASLTQWTWLWVHSGSWWWTGRPGMLQFMGSQSQTQLSDWTTTLGTYFLPGTVLAVDGRILSKKRQNPYPWELLRRQTLTKA